MEGRVADIQYCSVQYSTVPLSSRVRRAACDVPAACDSRKGSPGDVIERGGPHSPTNHHHHHQSAPLRLTTAATRTDMASLRNAIRGPVQQLARRGAAPLLPRLSAVPAPLVAARPFVPQASLHSTRRLFSAPQWASQGSIAYRDLKPETQSPSGVSLNPVPSIFACWLTHPDRRSPSSTSGSPTRSHRASSPAP